MGNFFGGKLCWRRYTNGQGVLKIQKLPYWIDGHLIQWHDMDLCFFLVWKLWICMLSCMCVIVTNPDGKSNVVSELLYLVITRTTAQCYEWKSFKRKITYSQSTVRSWEGRKLHRRYAKTFQKQPITTNVVITGQKSVRRHDSCFLSERVAS